jgi:hypothetical protein
MFNVNCDPRRVEVEYLPSNTQLGFWEKSSVQNESATRPNLSKAYYATQYTGRLSIL